MDTSDEQLTLMEEKIIANLIFCMFILQTLSLISNHKAIIIKHQDILSSHLDLYIKLKYVQEYILPTERTVQYIIQQCILIVFYISNTPNTNPDESVAVPAELKKKRQTKIVSRSGTTTCSSKKTTIATVPALRTVLRPYLDHRDTS